jgi:hypothetical protein
MTVVSWSLPRAPEPPPRSSGVLSVAEAGDDIARRRDAHTLSIARATAAGMDADIAGRARRTLGVDAAKEPGGRREIAFAVQASRAAAVLVRLAGAREIADVAPAGSTGSTGSTGPADRTRAAGPADCTSTTDPTGLAGSTTDSDRAGLPGVDHHDATAGSPEERQGCSGRGYGESSRRAHRGRMVHERAPACNCRVAVTEESAHDTRSKRTSTSVVPRMVEEPR